MPKKRLSESEMIEINDLYRVIGHHESESFTRLLLSATLALIGLSLGYGLYLQLRRALDLDPE